MIRREVERNVWRGQKPPPAYPGSSRQAPAQELADSPARRVLPSPNGTSERLELIQIKSGVALPQDGRVSVPKSASSSSGYHQQALAQIKSSLLPYENGPIPLTTHKVHDSCAFSNSELPATQHQHYSHGFEQDHPGKGIRRVEGDFEFVNRYENTDPPNGVLRRTPGVTAKVLRNPSFEGRRDLVVNVQRASPQLETASSSRSDSPSVTISCTPSSSTSDRSLLYVQVPASEPGTRSHITGSQPSVVHTSRQHLQNANGHHTPPPAAQCVAAASRDSPSPQLDLRAQVALPQVGRRISPVPAGGIYGYAGSSSSQCSTPQRGVSPVPPNRNIVINAGHSVSLQLCGESTLCTVQMGQKQSVINKRTTPPPAYLANMHIDTPSYARRPCQIASFNVSTNSSSGAASTSSLTSQHCQHSDTPSILQRMAVLSETSAGKQAVSSLAPGSRHAVAPAAVGPAPAQAWTARQAKAPIMQSKSTHVPKPALQTAVVPVNPNSVPTTNPPSYPSNHANVKRTDPPAYPVRVSAPPSYSQPTSTPGFVYPQSNVCVPATDPPSYDESVANQNRLAYNAVVPITEPPCYTTMVQAHIMSPLTNELQSVSIGQAAAYAAGNCPPSVCSTRSSNSDHTNAITVSTDFLSDSPYSASHSPLSTTSSPSTNSDYADIRNPPPPYPHRHSSPVPERRKKKPSIDDNESAEAEEAEEEEQSRESVIVKNYSPQAYKFYMEQHVENLMKIYQQRVERRRQLEKEMDKVGLSEEAQCEIRRLLQQKESNYMRLKRAKMDKSMFKKLKTLGIGAFGEVALVRKIDSGQLYAMKTLRKSDVLRRNQVAHVKAERDILAEADNEWVVKLYYSFQNKDNLYFVMEYIPGGDMMSLLIKFQIFQEPLARFYIAELVCAIESVHRMGFIHRDIKPDNILVDREGHIKLTDFGLCTGFRWTHNSKYYQKGNHNRQDSMDPDENWEIGNNCKCIGSSSGLKSEKPLERRRRRQHLRCLAHSLVGTPNYIAPEVLLRMGYTQLCDWWSVGVILYEMVVGQPPFHANTPAETQQKVINWQHSLHIPKEASISAAAEDIIYRLLTSPDERIGREGDGDGIKSHPFFSEIDWSTGLRRQAAPYIPTIRHSTDTSNFDPVDPDRLRHSDSNSGDEKEKKKANSDWNHENGKYPEHAFIEFTFRRFFDDGGHLLFPMSATILEQPGLEELGSDFGENGAQGGDRQDSQNPVYV
ncbi:PREDICTED: serine/threonine-protein kinase Warts-like [Priapulus caudatus]|uniref:non-specific serine/threonine protein kinase n=1 Tax=Priapulus caudatus TaxID=37621 RepID=A0ABM1EEU3_PRICU|nr:PREDICTED: serine/threonine-protein kinase Warts-like [Priapulus caudatus]